MPKLSFTTMGTPKQDARGAVAFAKEFGYNGVDLRVSDNKGEVHPDAIPGDLKAVKSIFDSEGIELAGLLCYNRVGNAERSSWQAMTDDLAKHMDIGLQLGSPAIRMFGGNPYGEVPTGDFIKRTADSINRALEMVDAPLGIVLQNHGGSYTAADGMVLCDTVRSNRYGLTFSPDHCVIMKEDIDGIFARVKPYARQLYVSDISYDVPEGFNRKHTGCLPGKGVVPIKEAYNALGGPAFEGFVSFKWEKIWQDHLEEPEVALPHFIKYWRELTA